MSLEISSKNQNQTMLNQLSTVECPDSTACGISHPVVLKSGRGSLVWDVEGREYLDLISGFGSLPLGHQSEAFKEAIQATSQGDLVIQGLGDLYPSEDKVEFISTLIDALPSHLTRASLALTGSQAVETALKTAMLYTNKSGFISFRQAYHGVDIGALAVTANPYFSQPFRGFTSKNESIRLPLNAPISDVLKAIQELQQSPRGFAGIIVEPIQGRGGIIQADAQWLEHLKTIADDHAAVLILDEIFTGMGRTGSLLASQVESHMVLLGKALGGGMPLSACVGREDVMQAWPLCQGEAIHTGTFYGHPLSCRVGLNTLNILKTDAFLSQVREKGQVTKQRLISRLSPNSKVREVRGEGLFLGIDFTEDGLGVKLADQLRTMGVLALPSGEKGNILSITPALNIPDDLLERACHLVTEGVEHVTTP